MNFKTKKEKSKNEEYQKPVVFSINESIEKEMSGVLGAAKGAAYMVGRSVAKSFSVAKQSKILSINS